MRKQIKKYIFEVTITEGNDEFWEELEDLTDKAGCKKVQEVIEDCLDPNYSGFVNVDVKLKKLRK